jgi:hypothetical protein
MNKLSKVLAAAAVAGAMALPLQSANAWGGGGPWGGNMFGMDFGQSTGWGYPYYGGGYGWGGPYGGGYPGGWGGYPGYGWGGYPGGYGYGYPAVVAPTAPATK